MKRTLYEYVNENINSKEQLEHDEQFGKKEEIAALLHIDSSETLNKIESAEKGHFPGW